jgi:hypothetical protein
MVFQLVVKGHIFLRILMTFSNNRCLWVEIKNIFHLEFKESYPIGKDENPFTF